MSEVIEEVKKKRGRKSSAVSESAVAAVDSGSLWDNRGLLKGLDYKFTPLGFVDWRAMVNPEFVVLNRQYAARKGIDLKIATEDEKTKYLAEWPDEGKLILLAGLRDVLRLRGFMSINYSISETPRGSSVAICTIELKPNFETGFAPVKCSGVASAAPETVDSAYKGAIEAIASNRALCRAIREGLNIYTVSEEELNPAEEIKIANNPINSYVALKDKCDKKGITFDTVKVYLAGRGLSDPSWVSFSDLPPTVVYDVLSFIQNPGERGGKE